MLEQADPRAPEAAQIFPEPRRGYDATSSNACRGVPLSFIWISRRIYIHIYTCICTQVYASHTYTDTYRHTQMCQYRSECTHIHVYKHAYIYGYVHMNVCAFI